MPDLFEMRVDFWPNLQETLFHQALLRREERGHKVLRSMTEVDLAPLDALSDEERPSWSAALVFEGHWSNRAGLNDDMERGNRYLADARSRTVLPEGAIPDPWRAALVEAAPPYRQHWWLEEQAADEAYVDRMKPLLAAYGPSLARRMAEIYRTPWPTVPIVVEVCAAAAPSAVRTVGGAGMPPPSTPLITVASRDPEASGDAALELLFDQASRLLAVKVRRLLAWNEHAQGRRLPALFDDDLVRFTVGQLVKERLGPSYIPLTERGPRVVEPHRLEVLRARWQPYLDGKAALETSLQELVTTIGEVPPPPPPASAVSASAPAGASAVPSAAAPVPAVPPASPAR